MKCIMVLCSLLVNLFLFAQGHTDLKENGLTGRVMKVITYVYDSARLEDKGWLPAEGSFHSRITYFYNQKGNLDSTHYLLRDPDKGHDIRLRTIYQFSNDKRSGYREYENGQLRESATITWIDAFNYLTRVKYTDVDDVAELMNSLSQDYRDLRGEVRIFGSDGSMTHCSSYENRLEGNKIVGAVNVDCLLNTPSTSEFIYQQHDDIKNPVIIIALDPSSKQPKRIWIRKLEYY